MTDETAALRRELASLRALVQVLDGNVAALAGRVCALEQGKPSPALVPGFARLQPVVCWPSSVAAPSRAGRALGDYFPSPKARTA